MAIGGNDVKVENADLSGMDASDFAEAVGSANSGAFSETVNEYGLFGIQTGSHEEDISASSFAGIKEGFLTALDGAIDSYIEAIDNKLAQLNTNPNIRQAFRGETVEAALQTLINNVDAEARAYSAALKAAEQAIVKAVAEAYATHDDSIATDIKTDASTLEAGATQ